MQYENKCHYSLLAETVKSQTRKPKCSKGYHCSRNAYMLVYKVQEEENTDPTTNNVEVPGGYLQMFCFSFLV